MPEIKSSGESQKIHLPFADLPQGVEAIEIEENILWLRLPLPMALDHVNIFAFWDAEGWTLIDTGMNTEKTRKLWLQILSGVLSKSPVRRVILTHHHPDHVGMAGWFQLHLKVEVLATRTAWLMARMLTLDVQDLPTNEAIEFYRRCGAPTDIISQYKARRPFNFADCVMPMPPRFTRLQEADRLHFGDRKWRVRIGHGHAPSHATLWCEDAPMIIGGDQFLADITPNIGVYPTEPNANPLRDWLHSCQQFAKFARSDQLVLPGHKKPFLGLPFRLNQLIENHRAALARIEAHLATPATVHDILEPLFGRPIQPREYGMAMAEAVAHMNWLNQKERVSHQLNSSTGAWLYHRC